MNAPAPHLVLGSVARITDFDSAPPEPLRVPRLRWRGGDYVLGEILDSGAVPYEVESPSGRLVEVVPGDLVLGALGTRTATLQIVGDWRQVGDGEALETLNAAAVLGRCTSASLPPPPIARLRYAGHASREGRPLGMADFAHRGVDESLTAPVVLIIGTSMEAGKTVAGKAIVRSLKRLGLRVAATKVTGVGRYRDVLAMGDAGADSIADFVDAGLSSTAVEPSEFEAATNALLSLLAASRPDVVVAEAGASPLEPYNGETAVRLLGKRVRCTVLCASDPYAVVGVMRAFGASPDLVAGRATSTEAGIALVRRFAGAPVLNLLDEGSGRALDAILSERLGLQGDRAT